MEYIIKNDKISVTISDKGAELRSVKDALGHEYIWGGDERYWKDRAPVLFPICGQILEKKYTANGKEYHMNGHGFAKKSVFEVTEKSDSSITMLLKQNEETLKEYPYNFELICEFSIEKNSLNVNFNVKNTDEKVLPYMIGWHPGFTLEGTNDINSFKLDFCGKKSLIWYPLQNGPFVRPYGEPYGIDGHYALNEEEIYKNDTMIFVGTGESTKLYSENAPHSIDFSWSKNLPYFCVWKADSSDARFVCLEPWSDVPNTGDVPENFDERKMSRLDSGKSEKYSYSVKFF